MLIGSFPIFALSNHTPFSQTQTGATVPLKNEQSVPSVERLISRNNFLRIPTMRHSSAVHIGNYYGYVLWQFYRDGFTKMFADTSD
jgi:hypothetical protein